MQTLGSRRPTVPAVNLQGQQEAIHEEMEAAIRQVLREQNFILGRQVEELEQAVARLQDCSYGIGCASGSDALLLSLLALGVGPGASVLVPAFTFFVTASAVARAGALPIFVDIDPRTFTMSPASVEEALHKLPADSPAKAIIPVHLYGQCADMERLTALAQREHLPLVEDAAQAILAQHRGRAAGSFGVCGCFSFYPTKNLGGFGDGGMLTTNDADLADRLRLLRNHGSKDKRIYTRLGLNSRLDTLQAAILLVKLRHLEEWTRLRQQKAAFYREAFLQSGLCEPAALYPTPEAPVVLPYQVREAKHVFHQFTVRSIRRDELAKHLFTNGIETAIYYPVPLRRQPAFSYLGSPLVACAESERAASEVLSLPLYPELTEEQQLLVIRQIRNFHFS